MSDGTVDQNDAILAHVEAIGGGYVWESDVFAVTLFDVTASDAQVVPLSHLRGVEQIALNCSRLSFSTIEAVAHIPGLCSLVLGRAALSSEQLATLRRIVPQVQVVANEP